MINSRDNIELSSQDKIFIFVIFFICFSLYTFEDLLL